MVFISSEGSLEIPSMDVVSFAFDRQQHFDEQQPILISAEVPSQYLDYTTYKSLVQRLIAGWRAYGLKRGDAVLCQVSSTFLFPVLFMSVVGAGGIFIGSNPADEQYEIEHFLRLGRPKFIIVDTHSLSKVSSACGHNVNKHKILLFDGDGLLACAKSNLVEERVLSNLNFTRLTDLLRCGHERWIVFSTKKESQSTPAVYYSTSGTTGLPKLAMVSHWNMLAHHLMLQKTSTYEVKRLVCLPLFHLFGAILTYIQPLRYGHKTYIMRRFDLQKYLHYHREHSITEAYMVPPMLMAIIKSKYNVRALMSTVRFVGIGAAPCDAMSVNTMRHLLTDATVSLMYGMTEIGVTTMFRQGEHDESGSVGRLLRGVEAKLIGIDGAEVQEDGEKGELYCYTEGVMLGYRDRERLNSGQQWFRTGDICYFNAGKLYVVGRAKELIKVKGWQVAPAEIEAVLLQHPDVVDAAVCGKPAPNGYDEVPCAYVVRRDVSRSTKIFAEDIYKFARQRLANYKALDGGVCFVKQIPRTASGKIQRGRLLDLTESK